MSVTIRDDEIFDAITSRVENEYEFNIDTDNEGWNIGVGT